MDKVELAKNGDKQAFNDLIEENKFKIYKTAKSILGNEDDVCDAIQDSLIRAYKGIKNLHNNEFFSTWLIRIVINKCYDIYNKQKSRKIIDISEAKDEELKVYDNYDEIGINAIIKTLDEDLRTITIMFYYDDLSVKDISEVLKIPEGTVKSRLSRARTKLYEILNKDGEYNVR
ncbi:MAG: sigma-70 family RNA polymerase sigma factor [Clostridia bacterium]|nr:sigma-70 family RNA polymerase sigma factor [Clostridia bacterium]